MDEQVLHIVVRSWPKGTSLGDVLRSPNEVSELAARITVFVPPNSKLLPRHCGATLVIEAGTDEDALYDGFDATVHSATGISRPALFPSSSENENRCCSLYTADDLARRRGEYSLAIFLNPPRGSDKTADMVANDLLGEIRMRLDPDILLGLLTLCAFTIDGVIVLAMEWRSKDAHHGFPHVLSGTLRDLGFSEDQLCAERPPPWDRIVDFPYVARPGMRFGRFGVLG